MSKRLVVGGIIGYYTININTWPWNIYTIVEKNVPIPANPLMVVSEAIIYGLEETHAHNSSTLLIAGTTCTVTVSPWTPDFRDIITHYHILRTK